MLISPVNIPRSDSITYESERRKRENRLHKTKPKKLCNLPLSFPLSDSITYESKAHKKESGENKMPYKIETIRKVVSLAKAEEKKLSSVNAEDIKICLSTGNRKIGKVMNVSLMPILTCGNCSGCSGYCYDVKACVQYPNTVINARMRNTVLLRKDREEFFKRIDSAIGRRKKNKFFRWHVAGDILDIDYFDRMVTIARNHQDFTFWTYTKMYHIVNRWIDENGAIPGNLHVMFSEWRGMPMDNPHGMPEFRVVFKDDEIKPVGHYCPGNCDVCKNLGRGCVAGETTYCNEH